MMVRGLSILFCLLGAANGEEAAIILLKDTAVCKDNPAAQGLTQSECAALHGQTVKTKDGLT